MDGCAEYIKNGLNPPECVRKATANYRERYDRIGNFIKEKCTIDMSKKTLRSNLNAAYRSWCSHPDNRFTPLSPTNFFNEIELRGYPVGKYAGEYYVKGLELVTQTSSDGMIKL
jgi:putative DNA primase/helicase